MVSTWLKRSGLSLLLMSWGCTENKPPVEQQLSRDSGTPQPTPAGMTSAPNNVALKAPPESGTMVPDSGTAVAGPGPGEDTGIPGAVLSPDKQFALTLPAGALVRSIILYDAAKRRKIAQINVDKSIVIKSSGADVQWTAGNHILLTWSAGTNIASGIVYGTDGKTVLRLMGSGMELSPSLRYAVMFPTMFADTPVIELYDLAAGRKVAQQTAPEGTRWIVEDVVWQDHDLLLRGREPTGPFQEIRIELEASP